MKPGNPKSYLSELSPCLSAEVCVVGVFVLIYFSKLHLLRMARGQQKVQSQAKAAEKSAKIKKQQGHSANDQKKAAQKALVHVCAICKAQMPDPKTYKQHFENKHPKNDLPEDLKDV